MAAGCFSGIMSRIKSMTNRNNSTQNKQNSNAEKKPADNQKQVASSTPATLNFALKNTTSSNNVNAYITGRAIDNNNALFILSADGKTPYYPSDVSGTVQPFARDCAIKLGAPGNTVTVTIPHLAGARIYFAVDNTLAFYLNPGPSLVEPSVTNPSDPNIKTKWGFCEFTYNSDQVFVNISYVDFVALPVALTLDSTDGSSQHVGGMGANGLDTICDQLRAQDNQDHAGWSSLIVQDGSGKNLRALSPNQGMVQNNNLFKDYYTNYVNQVWTKYASANMNVNTQTQLGTLAGRVNTSTALLTFNDQSFSKPTTGDIFSCSTGPFENSGPQERLAIIARLSAAFNRSTLLSTDTFPETAGPSTFYKNPVTNHYSRIVHSVNVDGRGYAFPYDDVVADGGVDQSGSVFSGNPKLVTVAVGGNN
jgi:hypothetical protein